MEYYLIRKKFVELSGRYDLVNPDWTDNGADFFFEAGQKFLDMLQDTKKMRAKNIQRIQAGTTIVKIAGLRSVIEARVAEYGQTSQTSGLLTVGGRYVIYNWITDDDFVNVGGLNVDGTEFVATGTTPTKWTNLSVVHKITSATELLSLSRVTLAELKNYYETAVAGITAGTPEYFALSNFRPFPDTTTVAAWADFYDSTDLVLGDAHYTYDGIVIAPPPLLPCYISIYGLYYSPTLTATLSTGTWTQTKSFWSEVHPALLIQAALYQLETFYRNTEGAKDWETAMRKTVTLLDMDSANEESIDISQMQG